ncbi:MAG: thiamine phosphate synthase [Clostridia bacterium]
MAIEGLHVLIDPDRVPAERLEPFLDAIAAGGAAVVQIRIKEGSTREALRYIGTVRALSDARLALIINDRLDWALASGADGVHLGQDDMPLDVARRLAPGLILGTSVSNRPEVEAVLPHHPDYVGIGPVFTTPSKADAGTPLGVSGLRDLIAGLPSSIIPIAIGGIEPENVAEVWRAGARGVAVIHAVTGAPDPERAARGLLTGHTGDPTLA